MRTTRDSARIDKLLNELRSFWIDNPDLRFFQVIAIILHQLNTTDGFYVEDDTIINTIMEMKK